MDAGHGVIMRNLEMKIFGEGGLDGESLKRGWSPCGFELVMNIC